MTGAAILLAAFGVGISVCARDFGWFARFGSLITFIGIIVLNRPSLVGQDILLDVTMADTGLGSTNPEHYRRVNEPVPPAVIQDQLSRSAVGRRGPAITLAGTVIWGFGDILNLVCGFSKQ
jgi:hypothetical protein